MITEIPYTMIGANIGKFLNDIASLVENKKTTDIVDISNQSSKEGIRIVLELKKGAEEITKVMEENGVQNLKVMPMVVFADNFQTPELYLGYGSYSTTYQELKSWYKKQSGVKEVQYDYDKVSSIIKGLVK